MDTAPAMALAMVLVMQSEDPPRPPSLIRSPPLLVSPLSEAMVVLVMDTVPPMALAMVVLVMAMESEDPPSELLEFPLFRPLEEATELDMVLATVMEMLEVPDSIDQFMS